MSTNQPRFIHVAIVAAAALGLALVPGGGTAQDDPPIDEMIRSYLAEREATVQLAPDQQLCRRFAIDMTGVIPSAADIEACSGLSPAEMFDYFRAKGPMPHTRGEDPYVWINLLRDADHFLFSNSTQFTQITHLRAYRDQLRRVYAGGMSYAEFARWALESQMFLSRFPSAADRANASFFLFLGRDSLATEVAVGRRWNGYALRSPGIPAGDADENPDYHAYDYDASRCDSRALCAAELWGQEGSTPEQAIDQMLGSHLFLEATVDRYWERFVGGPMPGLDFPELRRSLVNGFVANGHDVNWLIREIMTSAAYTQEMMYR